MRRLTYDLDWDDSAPLPGKYLVSITKKGKVGTVYFIGDVRKVKSLKYNRYVLVVTIAQEVKPFTEIDVESNQVWVRGEEGYPCHWYPRNKKNDSLPGKQKAS